MQHQLLFALSQFIIDEFTAHKTLIVFIVVGMVAGLVAQLIMPGRGHGLVVTAIIGIAGCYIGNLFVVKYILFVDNHVVRELIGAIVVSAVLTVAVNILFRPKEENAK